MTVENERGDEVGVPGDGFGHTGQSVFVVRKGTEEVLIPAAKSSCLGGFARRRMMVRGIDGLVEDRHAV